MLDQIPNTYRHLLIPLIILVLYALFLLLWRSKSKKLYIFSFCTFLTWFIVLLFKPNGQLLDMSSKTWEVKHLIIIYILMAVQLVSVVVFLILKRYKK
jgi:hypothetical protein